jgi:hypothetical protein
MKLFSADPARLGRFDGPPTSDAVPASIICGIGPAFTFATESHDELGQGKFDAGLSAVALTIRGHWLIGALATDVASVSGVSDRKSVRQMLVQPFINYSRAVGTSRAPRSSPRTERRLAVNSGPCRWAAALAARFASASRP